MSLWRNDRRRRGYFEQLVTGLFRRLIDLALADDLLALDAAGLAAAVEEVDVAELPQRIRRVGVDVGGQGCWPTCTKTTVPPRPNSSPPS